ncbi:MAG: hypothetical protein QXJ69_03705 [Desulfurococcaceae archaeon]
MSRETRRRFVPLPETLIEEAIKVSERVGMPYLVLIEKILESNLSIMKYKPTILKALLVADAIDDLRRLGAVLLPWSVVKSVLNSMSEEEFQALIGEMGRVSLWFGELSRVKHGSSPSMYEAALSAFMSSALVDVIQEGENIYRYVVTFLDQSPRIINLAEAIAINLAKGFNLNILDVKKGDNTLSIRVTGFFEKE